jgi:hypothetical protein
MLFFNYLFCLLFCLCFHLDGHTKSNQQYKIHYPLVDDPIDVVIVAHPKDKGTLEDCIEGIKENCRKIRRVIVISAEKLTDKAEWFNENWFPFSKKEVVWIITKGNKKKSEEFARYRHGPGWYFQQLLKLYAPFIIPHISSNVLVIDADTIFINPVEFLNDSLGGLFCFSHEKAKRGYLKHAERLVPGYQRIYPEIYSVCHHMLFQKPILKDLFRTVESYHGTKFWVAFCSCVDLKRSAGASEFEIYYHYALTHTDQVQLRELKWINSAHPEEKDDFKRAGYHFVAFHTYMRGKWPKTFTNGE